MNLNLENKIAVVTGASRGIGKAIKESLEREGARVYSLSRSEELPMFPADLSTMHGIYVSRAFINRLKPNILINNVGGGGRAPDLLESYEQVYNINVRPMLHLTHEALQTGRLKRVVTISSIPYVGVALSEILTTAVLKFNAFMVTFPYAQPVWFRFLWVIIPFEILLLVAKFFFGNRLPAHIS